MDAGPSHRRSHRRTAVRLTAGALFFATFAGIYAFRSLSARLGEGALRLIPNGARMVAVVDLSPSASQTVAFKRIDDALSRNGLDGMAEGSLISILEQTAPGAKALSKLIKRNGAAALLPGPDGTMDGCQPVAILALNDSAAAQAVLVKNGVPLFFKGLKYFRLKNGTANMLVLDDFLVVSGSPSALLQVRNVQTGAQPAITSNAQFASARTYLADDANVMLLLSPQLAEGFGPKTMAGGVTSDWTSMGLAIRDGGIGFSAAGVVDVSKNPSFAKLGLIPAIRPDLFKVLPAGAYGIFAQSQPSSFYEAAIPAVGKDKKAKKGVDDMEANLQKEIGLDFEKDVLPAFKGDSITAVYPTAVGAPAGLDVLLLIDDSNGGDPANAMSRFQDWMKRQGQKADGGKAPLWTEREAGAVHYFQISDSIQSDMRKSMAKGMDASQIDKSALVDRKTLAWAFVGKAVIGSTSQDLLDRAVRSYQEKTGGMDTDPKFAAYETKLLDGSQSLAMLSVSRIAEGIKNTVRTEKMSENDRKMFAASLASFAGLDQPFSVQSRVQADGRTSGGAFIPLDYDKVIDLIGGAMPKTKAAL